MYIGQPGSTRGKIVRNAHGNKFGRKNPLPKLSALMGVKVHVGISLGQPEVKLLRHAVWLPNLMQINFDQIVMY